MLTGCMTALVTPFRMDGSFDTEAFTTLIERQIEAGIQAILIMGSTGEGVSLSADERKVCIQLAVSVIKQRVPLIVNAGTNQLRMTCDYLEEAYHLGADYCLCIGPYYLKTSQEGILSYFKAINDHARLPLILYNVPTRTALDISTHTVEKLSELPRVCGIKEAHCSLERYAWYQQHLPTSCAVYIGDDDFVLTGYECGAAGLISVASNIIPGIMTRLCAAAAQKDQKTALRYYEQCTGLFSALFIEPNPIPVKWALHHMGLIQSAMRLPLIQMNAAHEAQLSAALSLLL